MGMMFGDYVVVVIDNEDGSYTCSAGRKYREIVKADSISEAEEKFVNMIK